MRHCSFLYNTAFDQASLTLAAGAVQADWPLTNLQDTLRRKVMKTSGSGNITINVDLGELETCSALGIVEHDLHADTPIILRAYSDAWSTQILETQFEAIGPLLGWQEGGWKSFGWKGYPTAEDLALYPRISAMFFFDITAARYWQIEIQNGPDAADEFYLGRILLGRHWEPLRPHSLGEVLGLVDNSRQDKSLGGIVYTDEEEQCYQVSFALDYLTEEEVLQEWAKLVRTVGTHKDFLLQLRDDSTKHRRLTTIYGRLTRVPQPKRVRSWRYAVQIEMRETL